MTPLPQLDEQVAALHQLVMPGDVGEAAHVETFGHGPAASVEEEDLEILGVMLSGKHGDVLGRIWDGDYSDFGGDESSGDIRLAGALAFYCAKDPARIERIMRAGPWRPKWDELRGSTTWLGGTIGKAIGSTRSVYIPGRRWEPLNEQDAAPAEPAEAPEQTIARLQRELAAERASKAALQTVLRATRAELERERELRALDRRAELAKQRLRRAWKPGQADAIIAVATIAPPIANAHQTDDPIITREMVAESSGAHPGTAGENLKVFDLEGSPIQRVRKMFGPKALTAYQLNGLTSVEILEGMADLGENLDKRPATRAKRVRCQTCPADTGTVVNIICAGCGALLDERHVAAPSADNVSETLALGERTTPTVIVPLTPQTRNARVAGPPEPDHDGRAAAMVGSGGHREVDRWKTLEARQPIDFEKLRTDRERAESPDPPDWLAEWPDDPPHAPPLPDPHRPEQRSWWSRPPAMMGGAE
ncbi:MAG: hypothetical protein IT307_18475 [Chloroflexi bacterium]|nr:hypothetical protein [Chloroflexota bacterium]